MNMVVGQQYIFSPTWLGTLTLDASALHLTEARNANLGFALAFPFSSTSGTISGFETFGDNQFVTPITAFPVLRNQEKYQFRYDVTHPRAATRRASAWTIIHEPVMSGALSGNGGESYRIRAWTPPTISAIRSNSAVDFSCTPTATLGVTPGTTCSSTPAGNGSFSQNVQRSGILRARFLAMTNRSDCELRYALRHDPWTLHRLGPVAIGEPRIADGRGAATFRCSHRRAP